MTGKRLDVQGLRALAILMVVAYHGRFGLRGGFTGVDVFFVISGFVITGTLLRELEQRGRLSITAFYTRRAKRLLPGLATMLTFVALAGMLLAPVAAVHMSAVTGMAASVFGANWYLYSLPSGYFDPAASLDPLLHTWTLGVEEQFYLVYPILLWAAWRVGRRFGAAGAVGAASVASLAIAVDWSSGHSQLAFYGSPARAWEFGLGCLIALGLPLWEQLPRGGAAACAGLGLVGVIGAMVGGDGSIARNQAPAAVGAALLIAAGSSGNALSSALGARPLVWIGDRSYSWYLWHWPLIVFAGALVPGSGFAIRGAAVLSLAPAAVSYRRIENPVRRASFRRSQLAVGAVACVGVPVACSLLQLTHPLTAATAYGGGAHEAYARGCAAGALPGSPQIRAHCVWKVAGARGTVVLLGDSNAAQFLAPVTTAANGLGYDAIVSTASGCPVVPLRVVDRTRLRDLRGCSAFAQQSLRALVRDRPSLVIFSIRSDGYIDVPRYRVGRLDSSQLTANATAKQTLWAGALRSEFRELSRHGIPVLLVHPIPLAPINAPACASVLVLVDDCGGKTLPRRKVDSELARTLAAERAAVAGVPDTRLLDLEGQFCSRTSCVTERHGVRLYFDELHLSQAGSKLLEPQFAAAIAQAVHARLQGSQRRLTTEASGVLVRG